MTLALLSLDPIKHDIFYHIQLGCFFAEPYKKTHLPLPSAEELFINVKNRKFKP